MKIKKLPIISAQVLACIVFAYASYRGLFIYFVSVFDMTLIEKLCVTCTVISIICIVLLILFLVVKSIIDIFDFLSQ